jgi:hypothetical protein
MRRVELAAQGNDEGHVIVLQQPILLAMQPQRIQVQPSNLGLTAAQIAEIPMRHLRREERVNELCSICLIEFSQLPPTDDASSSVASTDAAVEVEVSRVGAHPSRIYSADPIAVRVLPCAHIYHAECLDSWLHEKRQCPNCRIRIGPADDPPQSQAHQQAVNPQQMPVHFMWMRQMQAQQRQMFEQQQSLAHSPQEGHMPSAHPAPYQPVSFHMHSAPAPAAAASSAASSADVQRGPPD